MNFLMKFYKDRPGLGLPFLSSLPGLYTVLAWPAWRKPGPEATTCAGHRQTDRPSGLLGPLVPVLRIRVSGVLNIGDRCYETMLVEQKDW